MLKYPGPLLKATLVKRVNRFVAEVTLNDNNLKVYVPNTGRLSELALPGIDVLLSPINSKYKYKILYIIHRSFPVMIDSTNSNRLFHQLLIEKKVPGIEPYTFIKREPVYGNHRFDFLLSNENENTFIELKSCTLFHEKTGAFPDAVSSRASEHVKALAESGTGKLIFFVLKNDIERFIPNYHTDFFFYETLKFYKDKIEILAFTVQYDDDLNIHSLKKIPVIIPDVNPSGIFILLLFNQWNIADNAGDVLEQGYYIYTGYSSENVFKTIKSIKKKNGIKSITADERFFKMKVISALPIIDSLSDIDFIKAKMNENGGSEIVLNHQIDFSFNKQAVFFRNNPAEEPWFWDLILDLRFKSFS